MGNVTSTDPDRVGDSQTKKLKKNIGSISDRKQKRQQRQKQQQQQQQQQEQQQQKRRSEGSRSSTTSDQVDQEFIAGDLSFDSPQGSISAQHTSSRSSPITSRSPWTLRAANASGDDSSQLQQHQQHGHQLQSKLEGSSPRSSQADFYARSSSEDVSSPASSIPIDQPTSPWTVTTASSPTTILIATHNDFTSSALDAYNTFSSAAGSPVVDSAPTTAVPIPVLSIHEPHLQRFSTLDSPQNTYSPGTSPGAYLEMTDHHYRYNNSHGHRQQQHQNNSSEHRLMGTSPEAKEWLKQKPTRSSAHLIHQYNFNRQQYYTPPGVMKLPSSTSSSCASSRRNSGRIQVPGLHPKSSTGTVMMIQSAPLDISAIVSPVAVVSPVASKPRPRSIMAAALATEASKQHARLNVHTEDEEGRTSAS